MRHTAGAVNPGRLTARRATLDDLPALRGLWQSERLPGHELEKRLTEFHVVVRPDGTILGTAGLWVIGTEALVHSAAFVTPALAAESGGVLWQHLHTLAQTRGVVRLWMRAAEARWPGAAFAPAAPAQLKRRPTAFGPARERWFVHALRDEAAAAEAWEKEFAALQAHHQEEAERVRRRAAFWKLLAWGIAALFFAVTLWLLVVMWRTAPRSLAP